MRLFDSKKWVICSKLGAVCAVIFFFVVGFFSVSSHAFAATLSISPSVGQEAVGQTFSESVLVDAGSQAINAVSGTIS
jgi:hypothetical protein